MVLKRIIGVIIFLVGVVLIFMSNNIMSQVEEGKIEITEGQEKVDQGEQLFSLNPIAKEIGKGFTGSAQKKIDQGRRDVVYYEDLAGKLKIWGIVLIVVGVGVVFIGRWKKRR